MPTKKSRPNNGSTLLTSASVDDLVAVVLAAGVEGANSVRTSNWRVEGACDILVHASEQVFETTDLSLRIVELDREQLGDVLHLCGRS